MTFGIRLMQLDVNKWVPRLIFFSALCALGLVLMTVLHHVTLEHLHDMTTAANTTTTIPTSTTTTTTSFPPTPGLQ
jgi:hypothetical protein